MSGTSRMMHTEESAEVEVLLANMERLQTLTRKINGSLGRLDAVGRNIHDAMRPINGNTAKLQVSTANIDKINAAIENIRQPLDRRRKEEDVIRAGLNKVDINDYLASMDRTVQSLNNLRETNLKANQEAMAELTYLLKFGSGELEGTFRDTLLTEATPVEPLRIVTRGETFPVISERNSSKLRIINSYMTHNLVSERRQGEDPKTVIAYSEIRGPYISTSLQNLASASVSTARKTDPNALYRKQTSGIATYARALELMFSAEYDNICPIFAREQWVRLHGLTCNIAMQQLNSVLGDLYNHIRNNILTDCFLAYEICEVISGLSFKLESKNPDLRQPVQDALRPIREQAKYSLQRLFEDSRQRAGSIMTLSADASPVPLTQEIVARLSNMTGFMQPLSSILASVGEGGWRSTGGGAGAGRLDVGLNGTELFGSFCGDIIDAVLATLEAKAKALLKTTSAQGIFLANNAALIDRVTAMGELESFINDTTRNKMENWKKRAVLLYTAPWKEAAANLRDVQYTNRTSGGNRPPSNSVSGQDSATFIRGMSSKDKDATKEKFKAFNSTFEQLMATHRQLRPEREVRERLVVEVSSLIEPLYDRFWDRYHEVDKGKGKHVKYSKDALHSAIRGLG